ncbi:MAG: hypothetical protein A2Y12_17320 [Planctomycetes bacterium GWF2_42_9]|nr:MAG: hypothetical protein A2Y12_17320 [Planctomycetes bacterium GWF2_42_9]
MQRILCLIIVLWFCSFSELTICNAVDSNLITAGEVIFPKGTITTSASPIQGNIKIDGVIDEPQWENCLEFQDMSLYKSSEYPTNRTIIKMGYTNEFLYIAVECYIRGGKPKTITNEFDGPVYTDDSVELFIDPRTSDKKYYQFAVNADAVRYDGCVLDGAWNGNWQTAAKKYKNKWTLEISIPFSTIGVESKPGTILGFNIVRNDKLANQNQTWVDLGGSPYHTPELFGNLVLSKNAIGTKGTSIIFRKDDKIAINAHLKTNNAAPTDIKCLVIGNAGGKTFRFENIAVLSSQDSEKSIEKTNDDLKVEGKIKWQSAVLAGDDILYLSATRTANFTDLSPLLKKREPLVLANNKVSLSFDSQSGAIISFKNLGTNLEIIPNEIPQTLFTLDAVSYQKHPIFFSEQNVIPMEASAESARECKIEKRADNTQVLKSIHDFKEGVKVTVEVELPPNSEISNWKIYLDNQLPKLPREGVVIHRVVFPQIAGLRASESDKDQALAWPVDTGLLIREPARKASSILKVESPAGASMSWVDLSGPNGGLYMAGHDVNPVISTTFEAQGNPETNEVSLSMRRWSLLWPSNQWQPKSVSIGIHKGDWHWSADQYREWFYANCPVRPTPQWIRDEDAWMMDGGGPNRATFADIARTLTMAQNMGSNYVQSWQCHMATFSDEIYGMQMTNVYGGTEEEFIKALESLHERGGHIGFYFNAGDFESRAGAIMRQPKYKQKLSKEMLDVLPQPDPMSDGWLEMGRIEPDGSQKLGWPSGIDMRHGCYASEKWADWTYFWVTRYNNKYKADTWYQDITPWSTDGVCFHPNHGHKKPVQHAQATIDIGNRILGSVSKDYGIISESMTDRLWNYQTHSLWAAGLGLEDSEPSIFIYTHPKFPLFCGTVFYFGGSPGLGKTFFGIEKPSFADVMRYVLLHGQRFDLFRGPVRNAPECWTDEMKEEYDIVLLRKQVHADLEGSSFKDRIGLSLPEKIEGRVFLRDDLKGALISLLNLRNDKEEFTLIFDALKHGINLPLTAEIILPGGKIKPIENVSMENGIIKIILPADNGKMCFVRLNQTINNQ